MLTKWWNGVNVSIDDRVERRKNISIIIKNRLTWDESKLITKYYRLVNSWFS